MVTLTKEPSVCSVLLFVLAAFQSGCSAHPSEPSTDPIRKPFGPCDDLGVRDASALSDITVGNDVTVAAGTNGLILWSKSGGPWFRDASRTTLGLSSVVWTGKEFLAVAARKPTLADNKYQCWENVLLRSDDARDWQLSQLDIEGEVHVVTGGPHVVLAGTDGRSALIWIEEGDGSWTSVKHSGLDSVSDLTWGGRFYLATGRGPNWRAFILRSTDARTWSVVELPGRGWLSGISVVDSGFVVVGAYEEGGAIYTSKDGLDWIRVKTPVPYWLGDVTTNGKQTVAVGRQGLIVLLNDGEWAVQRSSTKANLYGVAWTGDKFVAVGAATAPVAPVIIESRDGVHWKTAQTDSLGY